MNIKKVVVCGGGVLGAQIAFQSQFCGFDTTIWLRSEGSIQRTKPKLSHVKKDYIESIEEMNKSKSPAKLARGIADSYSNFNYEESLKKSWWCLWKFKNKARSWRCSKRCRHSHRIYKRRLRYKNRII